MRSNFRAAARCNEMKSSNAVLHNECMLGADNKLGDLIEVKRWS